MVIDYDQLYFFSSITFQFLALRKIVFFSRSTYTLNSVFVFDAFPYDFLRLLPTEGFSCEVSKQFLFFFKGQQNCVRVQEGLHGRS